MTTEERCGAINPRNQQQSCVDKPGHKGMHFAGSGFHWQDGAKAPARAESKKAAPPKKAPAKAAPIDSESKLVRSHRRKQAEARAEVAARKAKPPAAAPKYCNEREGDTMRVCTLAPGHEGDHDSGVKTWPRLDDGLARAGYCAVRFASDEGEERQRVCTIPAGHDGPHANTSVGITEKKADARPTAQRCFCGGHHGKDKPHDLGAPVICRIPDYEMCVCIHGKERTHMIGAPGCTSTRVAAPPMTLDDEPEDPEADEEARLAAIDEDSEDEIADEPDSSARWYCEAPFIGVDGREYKCEHRNEHNGPHYAWSAVAGKTVHAKPSDGDAGEDNDPFEDEVRSDEDRAFARQQREAREAHAAELEAEPASAVAAGPLTKIGDYEVHPAAALFPMIDDAEYPAFRDDIRDNGQRKRIVRIGKLILDGRNRLRACIELGIEPKFREFGEDPSDGSDPIAFVISENVRRRHLNETQRAFVGAELVPMYEEQAKERQRGALKQNAGTVSPNSGSRDKGKATELAARAVNVGKTSIEAALKVKREAAPEVLAASKDAGKLSVSAAADLAKLPKQKQREIIEKVDSKTIKAGKVRALVKQEEKRAVVRKINEQRVAPTPMGPFRLIYVDWPWPYDNSDQHEGSRGHITYPSKSIADGIALAGDIDKIAHPDGCILGFWTTNAFVPEAVDMVRAWGFTWRTMYTWDKERDGVGTWGRGRTEHLIIASRGECTHTLNEVSTLLTAPRREHSRKPDEAAELFRVHCPGPHLEMFAREAREGYAAWGAEVDKFSTTEAA